jgi:multidrug efflux pump subunit AcrB
VVGPDDTSPEAERKLRDLAERVLDEIKSLPSVSNAEIMGARDYQIDIEISEKTLRKYGLELEQVAHIIRARNLERPGGTMRTKGQEILIRAKNKYLTGEEIAKLPVLTTRDGVVLTAGDLGTVRDGFVDTTAISRINGKPGYIISVNKTAQEDLMAITNELKEYVDGKPGLPPFVMNIASMFGKELSSGEVPPVSLPPGYSLETFNDMSVHVQGRLDLLTKNGLQGIILVFVLLAIFLEFRLAFWVALGIPISMMGAGAVMLGAGATLNMLSMFAFIMVLGILVDDAIVVGENIYHHRQLGEDFFTAAVRGTVEVVPSVTASVTTTIIAFIPMLFVPGIMGKFFAIIPFAVIIMLLFSLFESVFILPCHLAHGHGGKKSWIQIIHQMPLPLRMVVGYPFYAIGRALHYLFYPFLKIEGLTRHVNRWSAGALDYFSERFYQPGLRFSLHNPLLIICTGVAITLITIGGYKGGFIPFKAFPKTDSSMIHATITYPDGTPASVTIDATNRLEDAILKLNEKYEAKGRPVAQMVQRVVGKVSAAATRVGNEGVDGSHRGKVLVEMTDPSMRDVASMQVINEWREAAGTFPGAESVVFEGEQGGPGGKMIEFKLMAGRKNMELLEELTQMAKDKLSTYPGVFDIRDDSSPGKWEFQLKLKDKAKSLGLTEEELIRPVRARYYGQEVMRLQRGRHEVKLMVRYPEEERESLGDFDDIRIRVGGAERPLSELAEVNVQRGYSQINRLDQKRAITITADVDSAAGGSNAAEITADLKEDFFPKLLGKSRYRDVSVNWEGQQEQTEESIAGLMQGLIIALLAIFVLLTLEFRSYAQPLIIMAIIPFSTIGAIVGHLVMGMDVTLMSLFGMVALTGVVINDSIVLVDYINRTIGTSHHVQDVLVAAGARRLRPVLLTSFTTVAGLSPLMLETSFQAQFLIPMAVSLCFGLLFATVLILVFVPTFYLLYYRTLELLGARTPNEVLEQLEEGSTIVEEIEGSDETKEAESDESPAEDAPPAYVFPATVRPEPAGGATSTDDREDDTSDKPDESPQETLRLEVGKKTVEMETPQPPDQEETLKKERQYGS